MKYTSSIYSLIETAIKEYAFKKHEDVNHLYGDNLPYKYHLMMTAANVNKYCQSLNDNDKLVLVSSAYCHDLIEDTRTTYNDLIQDIGDIIRGIYKITRIANKREADFFNNFDYEIIAEIVFLLTNNKGRNRHERANDDYYNGIKSNDHAIIVKLCDRLANMQYSNLMFNHNKLYAYWSEHDDFIKKLELNNGVLSKDDVIHLTMNNVLYALNNEVEQVNKILKINDKVS